VRAAQVSHNVMTHQAGATRPIRSESSVERAGPSIEFKVVLLVAAAVVVQDLILLAMYLSGASPVAIQAALGGVLVLAILVAAVWGNAIARAVRRLTRACFVARHGDTSVLAELTRTDELGQLNDEINRLVVALRALAEERGALAEGADVAETAAGLAPDLLRTSHGILVSLKELREGASAESDIMRKVAGRLAATRSRLTEVAGRGGASGAGGEIGTKLSSLAALSREIELLADAVVDEVARPEIDDASLARAVNGVRDAARTMAEVAGQAVEPLSRARAHREAAAAALEHLEAADEGRADAARVAELMNRSSESGIREGSRLASVLKRLGLALESYGRRQRVR
jgi:methyl-accepting chemotaxis protein